MPKKKKKRDKGGDGMTLAQRIEAMKKEKEESAMKQSTVEEPPAPPPPPPPAQETRIEEPPQEIVNEVNRRSQEDAETQRPEDIDFQKGASDANLRPEMIPREFENSVDSFYVQTKDRNSQMNFDFGFLPPAMFLPEQSYISRRAHQLFSKYYDYIDNIDKLLDYNLSNIIVNNSKSPYDKTCRVDQDVPPEDAPVRALVRYLLSDTMQMEMDRFLAEL